MKKQKVAIYVRVSTIYQVDKDSLPMQKKDLVNYCEMILGIKDHEIFEDAGYSAKNTDRPAFQQMMVRLRAGEFSHVVVWKLDRISRNIGDFAKMWDEFEYLGVQFVSKNDNFQTDSPMGRAMLNIIMTFAQLEREMTSMRVRATMIARAKEGKWNGTAAPLGYTFNKEIMYPVPDEEEKKIVQFIFDEYEKEPSVLRIARLLNERNIKTKRNGSWYAKTITQTLRNPFYKGTLRYNYQDSGRGKIRPEEDWVIIPNNHEAIIDEAQFDRVQKILEKRSEPARRRVVVDKVHIFSGLLQCGTCGAGTSAHRDIKRKSGYHPSTYRCSNKAHGKLCSSKGVVTDTMLGNFILNYMSNMISIQNSGNYENLEERLLQGKVFKNVAYISEQSLADISEVMTLGYKPNKFKTDSRRDESSELEILQNRKPKIERALKRLDDLYLFADDALSEKDYLEKRMPLVTELNEINQQINALSKNKNAVSSLVDNKLLDQCILDWQLGSGKEIAYQEIAISVDSKILRDFFNDVIECVVVGDNNTILELNFKNGLKQKFLYR